MPRKIPVLIVVTFASLSIGAATNAQQPAATCVIADKPCLMNELESLTAAIVDERWRDQTWRETAKALAAANMLDRALAVIPKVKNPDTKAMTIRGIAMAAADLKLPKETYDDLFAKLRVEADKIEHAPSHAIALTYIGMAQAYARDDDGAHKTAASMTNAALRNKAYGETAEVQAERNDLAAALKSLAAIDDAGYRDKQTGLVSKILADRNNLQDALIAAYGIQGQYQKAQALLYILAKQNPSAEQKPEAAP